VPRQTLARPSHSRPQLHGAYQLGRDFSELVVICWQRKTRFLFFFCGGAHRCHILRIHVRPPPAACCAPRLRVTSLAFAYFTCFCLLHLFLLHFPSTCFLFCSHSARFSYEFMISELRGVRRGDNPANETALPPGVAASVLDTIDSGAHPNGGL
jgi:hypothetical protein